MADRMKRWCSYFIAVFAALLPTFAYNPCPKPVLLENSQVVPLHSDVNLTCPGCRGQTWWSRHNRTVKLQDGPHLSLMSIGYEDEDNYTCYRDGAPSCTVQLLVKDDIENPQISCYIRHPTHNITCHWQTTGELRPHLKVTLIEWINHKKNRCSYIPSIGKFTCSTPYKEGDNRRHVLSLCVIGRTDSRTSNRVDTTPDELVQPDPPINVTVTSLENQPRKLRVSWSPPRTWQNNFYQLQYQVQYRVEGTLHVSNGTTEEQDFMINDALARWRHVVRVRAKEELSHTWSAWSEEALGTPWSAKEENERPATTDFGGFTGTSAEEEETEAITEAKLSAPIPRYVWLVSGVSFVIVLALFLGILMRNGEVKLLKLKGGLLRVLFQPSRSAPEVPQPRPGEPLLKALSHFPEAVTVILPTPCDED